MKKLILPLLLVSTVSFGQSNYLAQLTIPQTSSDSLYEGELSSSGMRQIKVSSAYCEIFKLKREEIQMYSGTDRFSSEYEKLRPLENLCYLQIATNDDQGGLTGFSVSRQFEGGGERSLRFVFDKRAMNDAHLEITDDSQLTGRMSHDLLETTVQFIPRLVIPYIKLNQESLETKREVVLSTGESVVIDFAKSSIVGGVLESSPIDLELSRHTRKFVGLKYTGSGIMIRADRRAGTPRHIYRTSYNSNEKISKATLTYQGETCYIDKSLIWANSDNANLGAYLLYESDKELMDKVITPKCGWVLDTETF